MAVAFRSAASAGTSSSSTTLVINKPASVATNDVLVAAIWHPGTLGITPPSGWALVREGYRLSPNTGRLDVFVRTVDGSEGSTFTFTLPSSTHAAGGISAYSGCDPLTPIDEAVGFNDGAASFTALTHSSLTASRSDGHILAIGGYNASVTSTAPSGYTERFDQQATSAAHSCFMSDKAASSTSIASASTAITSTNLYYSTLHVVLRAANTMGSGSGYATPTQIQKVSGTAGFQTSISATYGTTPVSGRLLVACFTSQDWPTITPPAGWTLGVSLNGGGSAGSGHTEVIYYKISNGTESTVTFSVNTNRNIDLTIFEYSNIDTSSPVDTTGSRNPATYVADHWSAQITTTRPTLVIYAQAETFNSANQGGLLGNAFTEEYYRAQFARFGSRVVGGSITNMHTTALYPLSDDLVATNNTSSILVAFKAAVSGTDVTPSSVDTVLAGQVPAITATGNASPSAAATVLNAESATASVSTSASSGVAPFILAIDSPSVTTGQSAASAAVAMSLQGETPSLTFDNQVLADPVQFILAAQAAAPASSQTANPAEVPFVLSLLSPSIIFGSTASPSAVPLVLQAQAPADVGRIRIFLPRTFAGHGAGPVRCTETKYGSLVIDDVDMHTPAWCLPDLSALWGTPEYRGSNRLIPGRQGRKPYLLRKDETRYSLPLLVSGYCDSEGTRFGDDIDYGQGLEINVAFLQNNLVFPYGEIRLATLYLPTGNFRRSYVQVAGITGSLLAGGLFRATLELVDTEGNLAVGGEIFVDA